jgi:kynurenine 3-monooxygenase
MWSCYRAFYGQGMNAGFEDISILEMMEEYRDDWNDFSEYEKSRKPNADAIAELSYRNLEMSSKTADDKSTAEEDWKMVSDKHPDKWIPLYSRVTFSDPLYWSLSNRRWSNAIMEEVLKRKT